VGERMKKIIMTFLIILFILSLLSPLVQAARLGSSAKPITMNNSWQYCWGEEKVDKNTDPWKAWSIKQGEVTKNHKYPYLWLRVKLPPGNWQNPVLYIYGILADSLDVYSGNELIYHSDEADTVMDNRMFRKTVIPLWHYRQGATLYLKLKAEHNQFLGIYGTTCIGLHKDILAQIFKYKYDHIFLGLFFFVLAFITLATSIFVKDRNQKKATLALIVFMLCTGGWNLGEYDNIDLLFAYSPYWAYLDTISVLFSPIAGYYFLEQIFGSGPWQIIRRVWQWQSIYIIPYLIAILIDIDLSNQNIYSFLATFYSWSIIKFIFSTYILIALVVMFQKLRKQHNIEVKIISMGMLILALSIIFVDYNWANWGIFSFVVCLILVLGHRFVETHDCLQLYSQELKEKNEILGQWNETLEQTVTAKTASLSNLLDNAGQGFLTFGEDLVINEQYSEECKRIFGRDIKNLLIIDLLFAQDEEDRNFMGSIFQKILSHHDLVMQEKYLPLLPDELKVADRHIHLDYKIIEEPTEVDGYRFMLIITDITEKRLLESKMEQERNVLKMVVRAVVNCDDFQGSIKEYQNFYRFGLEQVLSNGNSLDEKINDIFKTIHTFKGTFSQLEMVNIVPHLHHLETKLIEIKGDLLKLSLTELREFFNSFPLEEWINKDLVILKGILGEEFFVEKDALKVKRLDLIRLERKMLSLLSPFECRSLLPDVQKLRFRSFKELLVPYAGHVEQLAEKLGKAINPLVIEGEDILVDSEKYNSFAKSLVHVFRNITDHGLEDWEERLDNGKDERCNVRCEIRREGNNLCLIIADDGRGIDLEKIKSLAISKEIYPKEIVASLSEEEVIDLIFADSFSTRESVSSISGRGMGLPIVKAETEKLRGKVIVSTKTNMGTEFRFLFPMEEKQQLPTVSPENIIQCLSETTVNIIQGQTGEKVSFIGNLYKAEKVSLKRHTALANIKGLVNLMMVMSIDEGLLRKITKSFLLEGLSLDEEAYLEDVLAEDWNIILGNSMPMLGSLGELVVLDSSFTLICSEKAAIKRTGEEIWTLDLEFAAGKLTLSLISAELELREELYC